VSAGSGANLVDAGQARRLDRPGTMEKVI